MRTIEDIIEDVKKVKDQFISRDVVLKLLSTVEDYDSNQEVIVLEVGEGQDVIDQVVMDLSIDEEDYIEYDSACFELNYNNKVELESIDLTGLEGLVREGIESFYEILQRSDRN